MTGGLDEIHYLAAGLVCEIEAALGLPVGCCRRIELIGEAVSEFNERIQDGVRREEERNRAAVRSCSRRS